MPPVTSITFTDTIGAATLTNGKSYPANRFANWAPMTRPIGDTVHRQSDGVPTHFNLRTQYGASFELRMIPQRTVSATRMDAIANRLINHLLRGGSCTVNTGDTDTAAYSTCYLWPGSEPSLTLSDPNQLEYTLSLMLFNTSTAMVCHYDP